MEVLIDQDALCEHCQATFKVDPSRCEGSHCDRAHESYLEEHELVESIAFYNLTPGRKVYVIKIDPAIPEIDKRLVKGVREVNGDLNIAFETGTTTIPKKVKIHNRHNNYFTDENGAKKELESICIKRIVALSKLIGTLNSK